jgi:hypothetical protein
VELERKPLLNGLPADFQLSPTDHRLKGSSLVSGLKFPLFSEERP